jgi:hypothetical protein
MRYGSASGSAAPARSGDPCAGRSVFELGLLVGDPLAAATLCAAFQAAGCQARLIGASWLEVRLPYEDVDEACAALHGLTSAWQHSFPEVRVLLPSKHRFLRVAA